MNLYRITYITTGCPTYVNYSEIIVSTETREIIVQAPSIHQAFEIFKDKTIPKVWKVTKIEEIGQLTT